MSLQEMKEEFKQSEGDPHIKGRIRQLRQQRMKKRMMAAVPKATRDHHQPDPLFGGAVLRPRHGGAGLRRQGRRQYRASRSGKSPREHDIPIVENVPLARALYATVDIDEEIPVEHYHAVAEIIGYVMGLKRGFSVAGLTSSGKSGSNAV